MPPQNLPFNPLGNKKPLFVPLAQNSQSTPSQLPQEDTSPVSSPLQRIGNQAKSLFVPIKNYVKNDIANSTLLGNKPQTNEEAFKQANNLVMGFGPGAIGSIEKKVIPKIGEELAPLARDAMNSLKEIKARYNIGEISLDEAKNLAKEHIPIVDKFSADLAKEHGVNAKKFNLIGFMRGMVTPEALIGIGSTVAGGLGLKSAYNALEKKFGTETYQAEETPVKPQNNVNQEVVPKVKSTRSDLYSPIHTLDVNIKRGEGEKAISTPIEVRTPPSRLQTTIQNTYANNPDLPKGLLETLLMKESSMGSSTHSKNNDIGAFAYLTGFTKVAKQELLKHGIVPDLNTPQGVLQATADFIKLKQHIKDSAGNIVHTYNNWTKWYNERYSSGKLKPEDLQTFDAMYKYYSNQ